jgi:hypothetical protein
VCEEIKDADKKCQEINTGNYLCSEIILGSTKTCKLNQDYSCFDLTTSSLDACIDPNTFVCEKLSTNQCRDS